VSNFDEEVILYNNLLELNKKIEDKELESKNYIKKEYLSTLQAIGDSQKKLDLSIQNIENFLSEKIGKTTSENQTKILNQIENKLKTDSQKLIKINSHFVNNVNATLETLSTVEKNLNWSIYEINRVKIGYIIGSLAIGLLVGFIGSTLFVSDKLLPFGYYKNNELGETLIIIEKNSPKVESTILDNGKEYLLIKTK